MCASCNGTAEARRKLAQALSEKYPAFPALSVKKAQSSPGALLVPSHPLAGMTARLRTSSRAGGHLLRRGLAWLESSLVGDAIACLCLMGALFGMILIAGVLP